MKFFERSRDQWKGKYLETKTRVKRLTNRVRFLEASKAHYKEQVKELQRELAEVKAREQRWQEGGEGKKSSASGPQC